MVVRTAVLMILLVLAGAAGGRAQEVVVYPGPGEVVSGTNDVTYADLLRLVVADLEAGEEGFSGSQLIGLRHIDAEMGDVEAPASIRAYRIAALPVGNEAGERLALFFDLGASAEGAEGFAVLALFDISGAPALLDAANVAFDRDSFLLAPYRLDLGGGDLLLTSSAHHNSSQGYAAAALVLVRDDRLDLVDAVFTLSDRACAFDRTQRIDVSAVGGEPFSDIQAIVTESTAATDEDCGDDTVPEPGERTISVTYRWDSNRSRYLPDSDAFERLARENEQRF